MKPDHPWGRGGNRDAFLRIAEAAGYPDGTHGQLLVAVTHKSFANEAVEHVEHNERFEFLGDAVLDLVIAEALMLAHPALPEGDLSQRRAALVSSRSLSQVANELSLGEALRLGRGEERTAGRSKESLLADAFEAVIGAVYLDLGLAVAKQFILKHFADRVAREDVRTVDVDYKTRLQEVTQKTFHCGPLYTIKNESGPDHAKVFTVEVQVAGDVFGVGQGRSKKAAERAAAADALESLGRRRTAD